MSGHTKAEEVLREARDALSENLGRYGGTDAAYRTLERIDAALREQTHQAPQDMGAHFGGSCEKLR